MPTSWTLTAQQICRDALEHIGVLGAEETPSAADQNKALRALDAVLKELPLAGYVWPKLSGEVALTWDAGSPAVIAAPADYYGYPIVRKTVGGESVPLIPLTHAEWVAMTNRAATGEPTHFYMTPANVITFYPVPTEDPGAVLQYQKIVDDAAVGATPDLPQYWLNALSYGVADEIGLAFGIPQPVRGEIAQRWAFKRDRALSGSIPSAPISFSVED